MKLRLKGNTVRLRLDRRDIERLVETGRVEDVLRFGPDVRRQFAYAVEIGAAPPGHPCVDYAEGRLVVRITRGDAEAWAGSDRVGFEGEQPTDAGTVRVLLEKDFACIDRPPGEEADDVWAFPNPSLVC